MADYFLIPAAYLIGAIPSAYLFGKLFKHLDIRRVGSGNVGALNTFKNIGYLPGALTLMADIAKGALAVYLASLYGSWAYLPLAAAFFAILGHNYNIFLGFEGGKGLGSLIGCLMVISPLTILYTLVLIVIAALIMRDTNTAAGLAVLIMPIFLGLQKGDWVFFLFGAAVAVPVVLKHGRDFRAYRQGRRKLI